MKRKSKFELGEVLSQMTIMRIVKLIEDVNDRKVERESFHEKLVELLKREKGSLEKKNVQPEYLAYEIEKDLGKRFQF